jgi:hypothetical protein
MELLRQQISEAVQGVVDGYADPLEVWVELKKVEQVLDSAKKEIEGAVIKTADNFESKTFEYKGVIFTKNDGRAMYDFKNCSQWVKIKEQLKEIEDKAKASASNYAKFKSHLITEDGEVVEPCIVSYSKPSITIKFKA